MSEPAWQHHGIPERCSSPLVPDSLMRQSQQRATSASGTLHKSHSQLLHESYPQPTRSGSPVPAPFRVSLQRLPVAAGKLVAEKPLGSYIAPAEPCQASTRYSTDTLRTCSTPHGQKYFPTTSRSAGSSPLPAAAAAHACGIAAAWLGHQQQQAQSADAQHLTASSDTSSSSGSGSTLPSIHHRRVQQHGPQRQGAGASSVTSTVQDDGAMDQVLQDPVSHLIQQADAATAAGMAAAQHALRQAAEADHAGSSMAATSSSSIGSSNAGKPGVQVFTRNHAIQLETELQVLPAGQLLAAQQQHIQAWASQQQTQWQRQLQAEASLLDCYHHQHQQQQQQQSAQHQQGSLGSELVSQQLLPWQQHISRLAQQLTQQVAYHCVEHGRTLEVLQERYAELANALFLAITCLSQHHAALSAVSQATVSALAASRSHAADLQQQLSAQQVATQEAQQQLAALSAQHEELQVNSQETIKQLQQLVESLKEQLWQARSDTEQQAADAQAAAALEAALTKRLLAEAEDEATDLRERLAFVHAQLQAVKEQQRVEPDTDTVAVQTEAEQQAPCVVATAIEQPPEEASEEDTDTEESLDDAPDVPKAINLLDYVSRGTKRSRLWVVKVLGQITADKSVADTVADRQGMSRSSMKDFVPIWGLNRYGLQHLSDQVLGDLCASICHHAAAGLLPARWFACFCSLGPAVKPKKKQRLLGPWQIPGHGYRGAGEQGASGRASPAERSIRKALKGLGPADAEVLLGSAAAADFWVFCACQLAYPNSVVALFPEAQEALPLVRSNLVMESIKAAFRYLGDPTGQAQFVADRLDLAAVAADTAAATAGASAGTDRGSSSRPGTSKTNTSRPSTACSVVGSFGFYNAWALLDLLLAEWLARAWGRARTMARLRREVAMLQPPLEQQYAAAVTVASAADSPHAQLLHKLQDAYAVLQPLLNLEAEPLSTADPAGAGAQDANDQQQHHQQQQERPSAGVQERPASALQQQVAAPDAAAGACNSSSQQAEAEDAATQLLQDAANADAEGALRTYKLLLSLMKLVLPAETDSSTAEEDSAAAADAAAEAEATAAAAAEHLTGQQVTRRPVTSSTAAAEVQRACSQGIVLNERLQQKLAAAGVTFAQGVSTGSGHDASAAAQTAATLAQQLAQSGALASALAAAREQRLLFK